MTWTLHHRYAYPLWWNLGIATWDWALPLRIKVRPWLTDGSGRREHVTSVKLSLLCMHWECHYAWGRHRYHPPPEPIMSLKAVLERDRAEGLTPGHGSPHNDA
jgi:hypothetical protein